MSRLHREVMLLLIEEIIDGDPPPGEMLPKEVDLAERFRVSRGVARECIRGLEERGLVAVKHGRGASVRDPAEWNVLDPDVATALDAGPDRRRFHAEALECQRLIEVQAAALAAERAQDADMTELEQALDAMNSGATRSARSESAARRYREANMRFHRAVVRATGNRMLARMSEPLHRALEAAGAEGGDRKRRLDEHESIVEAIAGRDPARAQAAMDEHLTAVARRGR
jgi:GntR family transcriptional repressor for pyruvate dehydrogenase complex